MSRNRIEALFPRLSCCSFSITSPMTRNYNCIAWAAGVTDVWWWPLRGYYWPPGVERRETKEAFISAYETLGYSLCTDANFEEGFDKIAIYVNSRGKPTHAARLLGPGCWTSKLGNLEDIEYSSLEGLQCANYGSAATFMKRLTQ